MGSSTSSVHFWYVTLVQQAAEAWPFYDLLLIMTRCVFLLLRPSAGFRGLFAAARAAAAVREHRWREEEEDTARHDQ